MSICCLNSIMRIKVFLICIFFIKCVTVYSYKLTPYIPSYNQTGTAVLVCPGGSYFWLAKKTEGKLVAEWLCQNGIAAFVLEYHHSGWPAFAFHTNKAKGCYPECYNDVSKAIDYIIQNADKFGIRRDRIGCMGFSAGGHLSILAAVQEPTASKLAFIAPMYPVVSMTHKCSHARSIRGLLGEHPSISMLNKMSLENQIKSSCPPVFLMNCKDDPIVDSYNSELLDSALNANNIPHHFISYDTGGHGFGTSPTKTTAEAMGWKNEFLIWHKQLFYKDNL